MKIVFRIAKAMTELIPNAWASPKNFVAAPLD